MLSIKQKFILVVVCIVSFVTACVFLFTCGCTSGTSSLSSTSSADQYSLNESQSLDLSAALKNAKSGYFSNEDVEFLKEFGGLPNGQGQTFTDDTGNKYIAMVIDELGTIEIVNISDKDGNVLVDTQYNPEKDSTSMSVVDHSKQLEDYLHYWISVSSTNCTQIKYLLEDGSAASYEKRDIVGYKYLTVEEYNNFKNL